MLAPGALAAFDAVVPGAPPAFPRDGGAHPGHRIEWWYVTGHLDSKEGPLGFHVTFFRVRNPDAESNPSRFSPKQLLFAHAALSDPSQQRLRHEQRTARMLEGLVEAGIERTDVRLDDWSLRRDPDGYRLRVAAADFRFDLLLSPSQPVLPQGERGFSRKGPLPAHASYYYSEPQLRAAGTVWTRGASQVVSGIAWLDHEWSSELLADEAVGWDWLGGNLDDGGAVMVFRIRRRDGSTLWTGATLRGPAGPAVSLPPERVAFRSLRTWRSPRTAVVYPVSMEVR